MVTNHLSLARGRRSANNNDDNTANDVIVLYGRYDNAFHIDGEYIDRVSDCQEQPCAPQP
jgi:hypothetical protein